MLLSYPLLTIAIFKIMFKNQVNFDFLKKLRYTLIGNGELHITDLTERIPKSYNMVNTHEIKVSLASKSDFKKTADKLRETYDKQYLDINA